ncbi:MAG: hypothetical protein ACI8WM_002915 [Burkholderiaceae bacterium]|jgi:hypothetical protein
MHLKQDPVHAISAVYFSCPYFASAFKSDPAPAKNVRANALPQIEKSSGATTNWTLKGGVWLDAKRHHPEAIGGFLEATKRLA